jgi:flagellar hook-length control protein FliK
MVAIVLDVTGAAQTAANAVDAGASLAGEMTARPTTAPGPSTEEGGPADAVNATAARGTPPGDGAAKNASAEPGDQIGAHGETSVPQTQSDKAAAAPGQNLAANGDADTAAERVGAGGKTSALGAAASAEARSETNNAAKPSSPDGLPNFGLSNATMGFSATATAPARAAAAAGESIPVAGLAVAIAAKAKAGTNQFEIRLDPPELGRIDVRLGVDAGGQVTSHVTVDRAETLQLLQSHQPQLERAFEQAGLKTADNGLQFTLRDQSFANGNNGGGAQPGAAHLVVPDADSPAAEATQTYARAILRGGIDIRV